MSDEALACEGLWVRYGDEVANRDVTLRIGRGEIHALVGENGAGKSTLMRAFYGLVRPERGQIRLFGVARPAASPEEQVQESIRRGLGMVHQHFMLVPTLSVIENVVLGREPTRRGALALDGAAVELAALAARFGLRLDARARVGDLSVGEKQHVEIAKVLWRGAEALILDEPTQILAPGEVEALFEVMRALAKEGKTLVLVTHKLDEVLRVAGRVSVMRRGALVAEHAVAEVDAATLTTEMIGGLARRGADGPRSIAAEVPPAPMRARVASDGSGGLVVRGLRVAQSAEAGEVGAVRVDDVSFAAAPGEILAVAGVQGNGQSELGLALAGLLPASGSVHLGGDDLARLSPHGRRRLGVRYIAEDRARFGLVGGFSLVENLTLGHEARYAWGGGLGVRRARRATECAELITRLDVRPPNAAARAETLSGGNQQKLLVGRELLGEPRLLIAAQPTRGVDLGAAARIHAELARVAAAGCVVVLLSTDLDEILALADRVIVLRGGAIAGEVTPATAREAARGDLGRLMLGGEAAAHGA